MQSVSSRFPSEKIVCEIPNAAKRLCDYLRAFVPTTAPDSLAKSDFGKKQIDNNLVAELDRFTYLFYGRTVADYERDHADAMKHWIYPIEGWIVATPTSIERAELEKHHDSIQLMHSTYSGWPCQVTQCIDPLFWAMGTLRVFFHRDVVFSRDHWIKGGEWLFDNWVNIQFGDGPAPSREPWFDSDWCRAPVYGSWPPEPYQSPLMQKSDPPIPDSIKRCGLFEQQRTDGLPIEWVNSIEEYAKLLREALEETGLLQDDQAKKSTPAVARMQSAVASPFVAPETTEVTIQAGERSVLKPWPDTITNVSIEQISEVRSKVEAIAHALETRQFSFNYLLDCADPSLPVHLSTDNSTAAVFRIWKEYIQAFQDNMLLDREVEVLIETASASNSQVAEVIFPHRSEIAAACGIKLPGESKLNSVSTIFIKTGEQPTVGFDFAKELGGSPVDDIQPSKFIYPTAHEAISMAGRHLVSLLHLNDECGELALEDPWFFERYRAILRTWFYGIAELRARIGSEFATAVEWARENGNPQTSLESDGMLTGSDTETQQEQTGSFDDSEESLPRLESVSSSSLKSPQEAGKQRFANVLVGALAGLMAVWWCLPQFAAFGSTRLLVTVFLVVASTVTGLLGWFQFRRRNWEKFTLYGLGAILILRSALPKIAGELGITGNAENSQFSGIIAGYLGLGESNDIAWLELICGVVLVGLAWYSKQILSENEK